MSPRVATADTEHRVQGNSKAGRVAVFASGTGSNLQAIIDYAALPATHRADDGHAGCSFEVALVVSDKPACEAVARAERAGIRVFTQRVADFPDKATYERSILQVLRTVGIDFVVLAGYMRLIGPELLQAYPGQIVNIHPSLLPQFPGRTPIQDALAAGAEETGVTVHYVDAGIDTGAIIAQWRMPVEADADFVGTAERIHQIEHRLYPVVIDQLIASRRTKESDKR